MVSQKARQEQTIDYLAAQVREWKERYAILAQRFHIMENRLNHADIEMAQARVSRDNYRDKLTSILLRMKEQGIVLEDPEELHDEIPKAATG